MTEIENGFGERSGYEKALKVYDEYQKNMIDFLQEVSPVSFHTQNVNWRIQRNWLTKEYGDNHLITIFPEELTYSSSLITITLNYLAKQGIFTKEQLHLADNEKIIGHNRYGKKTAKLINLIQDVLLAEQYVEWNSYNR